MSPLCLPLRLYLPTFLKALLELVRAELDPELRDLLVPLVNGGVKLHKIFGLMHDTCSTANRVTELMAELREKKAREFVGEDTWAVLDPCQKVVHDFLCGNHSRNLLVDRVNVNGYYDDFLEKELGDAMRAACVACDGRVRLECSGVSFLRSMCRLTHRGHAQYVKGDGDAFADFLEANYPGLSNGCLSRADYSNRQDWSLEAAYEIYPLLQPLLDYEMKSLLDDANVLRDSILIQLETLHFEVYCHVCALLWRVLFKELRGLTNSKGLEIDPLTLNSIYEDLYDVGLLMQTDKALVLLEPQFRPWAHIYQNNKRSRNFYKDVERNLAADMAILRAYTGREDVEKYEKMLCTVLGLFGKGIVASLEFTMKNYLKQTNGRLRTNLREDWELKRCKDMLCHNNHAERPFAVLRKYKHLYPSLSLGNLSKLAQSLVNGTHRPASNGLAAGIALTADARLCTIIGLLCRVRRKTVNPSLPHLEYTLALPTNFTTQVVYPMSIPTQGRKDREVHAGGMARSNNGGARIAFLKDQFHARMSGENPRVYPGIGAAFRTKFGKLKLTPADAKANKEEYLIAHIKSMIAEDQDLPGTNNTMPNYTENFIRVLPSLSEAYTNPVACNLKAEFAKHIAEIAGPKDDPVYVELVGMYVGKILYDYETRATSKLFRVSAIQFVRSFTSTRHICWEATCEPVQRDPRTGHFGVPHDVQVPGSNVTLTHALQGYCLVEYPHGIDGEPSYLPWVQQYIDSITSAT